MRIRTWIVIALSVAVAGCETVSTTQPGAVGVDRQQRMLVSQQEIDQAAAGEYRKVIAQAQQKGVLDRDAQLVQRVRNVANRLIPHT
ncbi:MAG: M48 family peptidase, partial [Burkholderiales bacterium]